MRASAYSPTLRLVGGTLFAASRASLPYLLLLVLLSTDPPVTPPVLLRLFTVVFVIPAFAALAIERACRIDLEVDAVSTRVRRMDLSVDIPHAAVAAVKPWRVPLPGPGLTFALRSGRAAPYGIVPDDPAGFLDSLAIHGVSAAERARRHPAVAWASARASLAPRGLVHALGKYVVFGFLPAAVLFNAHQHIAYGGLWGQYYLEGAYAWLRTLAVYWATTSIYVLLYASVLRALAEAVTLVDARVAPSRAAKVRRGVEAVCRLLYYAGVPALLALRFLA